MSALWPWDFDPPIEDDGEDEEPMVELPDGDGETRSYISRQ